ncbi:MAG: Cys-tRNA(Pro) deacylase [Treponema sp.]|jgi:Cys-tRNA(Pro)/Cys-tRNA(Cys) deacylase|nr:Cys-tRNA(Pro) deacylase [Treponema sp.]
MQKTNAMRLLEAANISFTVKEYPVDEAELSGGVPARGAGIRTAALIGVPAEQIFKTLVLQGASLSYFVCCIPAAEELDLKKAARASGEKKVDLIAVKDLLPLTGYVRGGCTPIGMKKPFPLFIDETAELFDTICISAGEIGKQIVIAPGDLVRYTGAVLADLTVAG